MKINHIKLRNFKFHHDLEFDIKEKNCLIYGENGTGKSSIYWAIYSIFKSNFIDVSKYKTFGLTDEETVKVTIKLENDIEVNTENTPHQLIEDNSRTIYFLHQDLSEYIISEKNFYIVIEELLLKYFNQRFEPYIHIFDTINNEITRANHIEKMTERNNNIEEFECFLNSLELRSNDIIRNHFEEPFIISFSYDWGSSKTDSGIFTYSKPNIKIYIDNKEELKLNFNEAKLKLTSIAIFFALIKLNENKENSLKVLVLDDFLTSIDMGNRKLIVQYIVNSFEKYQKIILTHNIQFYNLIIRLLKLRKKDDDTEELTDWDIKNIFIREYEDKNLSVIIDKEEDYLKKAKNKLDEYELEVSGNFLRKEFERTVTEFEQLLELGRVEELDKVVKALVSLDYLFPEPSKNLNTIVTKFNNIINNISNTDNEKYIQLKSEIKELPNKLKFRNNDLDFLKKTILKTEFYKDILMNSSSHDDTQKELYTKEFQKSIKILENLKRILKNLK